MNFVIFINTLNYLLTLKFNKNEESPLPPKTDFKLMLFLLKYELIEPPPVELYIAKIAKIAQV